MLLLILFYVLHITYKIYIAIYHFDRLEQNYSGQIEKAMEFLNHFKTNYVRTNTTQKPVITFQSAFIINRKVKVLNR